MIRPCLLFLFLLLAEFSPGWGSTEGAERFAEVLREIYRASHVSPEEVAEAETRALEAAGGSLSPSQGARLFAALAPAYAHNRGYADTRKELLSRIREALYYDDAYDVVPELRLALAFNSLRYGYVRQANHDLNSVLLGVRGQTGAELRFLSLQRAALLALANDSPHHAWRLVGRREELGSLDKASTRPSSLLLRALVAAALQNAEAMESALATFAAEIHPGTDPFILRRYWLLRAAQVLVDGKNSGLDPFLQSAAEVPVPLSDADRGWILLLRAAAANASENGAESVQSLLEASRHAFADAGRPAYQLYALGIFFRMYYLKRDREMSPVLLETLADYAIIDSDTAATANAFTAKGILLKQEGRYEEAMDSFRHADRKVKRDRAMMDYLQSEWLLREGVLDSMNLEENSFNVYLMTLVMLLLALMLVLVLRIRTQRHINDRLRDSVETARMAEQAAQHASKLRSEFLSNVSHEIKTPMSGLVGMASILDELISDPVQRKYLDTIRICSRNLVVLLNDLLDLGRLENSEFKLDKVAFNLQETVQHSMQLLWPCAEDKGIQLDLRINGQIPRHLIGDPTRISQILVNLLDNAVKFTEAGSVTLRVQFEPASAIEGILHLQVSDTGIGIGPESLRTVFEPFNQREPVYPHRGVGSGLGLTICHKLVTLMGGRITVQSTVGVGTHFSMQLPMAIGKDLP